MLDTYVLQCCIKRKTKTCAVFLDTNPCGFRLKPADELTDADVYNLDFVGLYSKGVTRQQLINDVTTTLQIQGAA